VYDLKIISGCAFKRKGYAKSCTFRMNFQITLFFLPQNLFILAWMLKKKELLYTFAKLQVFADLFFSAGVSPYTRKIPSNTSA
jgi:hypothetical protein